MFKASKSWIFIFLIVLAVLFYWFQVRPANVRVACKKRSVEKLEENYGDEKRSADFWKKSYDLHYDICLNEKGLK